MTVYWNKPTPTSPGFYSISKFDYVQEKIESFTNFSEWPKASQDAAIAEWTAEAPTDEAQEVDETVEEVRKTRDWLKNVSRIAETGGEAKKLLTLGVLKKWSAEDAKKVVGVKTVKTKGVSREVNVTAIEDLRDAAGLLGWPALVSWIATKREDAKTKLSETNDRDFTAVEGIDDEVLALVLKHARD